MNTSLIVSPWARVTEPDEPGGGGGRGWEEAAAEHFLWESGLVSSDETTVNHITAMTCSAVFACVRIISQTVSSMGWHQFESLGEKEGKNRIGYEDDVTWLLDQQANPEMNAYEWRQVMLKDALTWGNGVSEIERDGMGRIRGLWRIDPARATLSRTDSGRLIYVIDEDTENETFLPPEKVFHLKGLSPDGLVGYSVIDLASRYIRLGLDIGKFGEAFFSKGPMPGGVLTMPGRVTQAEKADTRRSMEKVYGGSKNAGRVIVLSGGATFEQMSMANTDSQYNESWQAIVLDICRFYGVPPHKVSDLSRATFSNIEHQSIEFVQDCILPWCRRLETEADIKLFPRTNRGTRYTRINIDSLLRGDSTAQTTTVTQKVNNGLMTIDEGRDYFGLNPIPGGDTPLVQGAMVPLERVLEEPEPEPAPAPPTPPDDEEDADEEGDEEEVPEDVAATFTPLLADAYGRLLRVKADKSRRGKLDMGEHRVHVTQSLLPILKALALAGRFEPSRADDAAELLTERYSTNAFDKAGPTELLYAWRQMQ